MVLFYTQNYAKKVIIHMGPKGFSFRDVWCFYSSYSPIKKLEHKYTCIKTLLLIDVT